jgi:hypothetical protein
MQYYLGVAKKEGITDEEIGAAQTIVMAVAGGRINAQFREAQMQGKIQPSEEKSGTCGARKC